MLIVVPFNRPAQLDHVLTQWWQQTVMVPLVLVCNESLLSEGSWAQDAIEAGATVITGQASIGGARNAGVQYAKQLGQDWIVAWDDDNVYSSKYIETIQSNIDDDTDVISLGIAFVRFEDGNLHLFKTPLTFAPGHCTAYRVEKSAEFPKVNLSEDVIWSRRMRETGCKFKHIAPWYSIYNRTGTGHAFGAGKHEFMECFGESYCIGNVNDSFVDKPIDLSRYSLVEGSVLKVWDELHARLERAMATGMFI